MSSREERIGLNEAVFREVNERIENLAAVHPGHEYPDVESVVARLKGYDVVVKNRRAPGRIAEQTDPRGT